MSASLEQYSYAYSLVKSYFVICTKGCGAVPGKCSNEFCGSNKKWQPNDAAIQSLYLALEKPAPLCDSRFFTTPKDKEQQEKKGKKEEDTPNGPEVEEEQSEEDERLSPFPQSPPSTPRHRLITAIALDSHLNTIFFPSERTNTTGKLPMSKHLQTQNNSEQEENE